MPQANYPEEIKYWQTVQQILRGYRTAQVMITCAQFGIFDQLVDRPRTATELAHVTGAHPDALRRLLDGAVAVGLLTLEADKYANTPLAAACLAGDGPYHLANLVRREGAFYLRWGQLTEAVRTGQRPESNTRDEDQENWVFDFELALLDLARAAGPVIAEALDLPVGRPLNVLDVGGGHGGYSMALARRYPNVRAVVFELPAAAEVAQQIIASEGMSERISVQTGDFQQEELGRDYDLVLLFGVLVSESPAGKLSLLRKVFSALVPGGTVAIRESFLSNDNPASSWSAMFSLQMLLSTGVGDLTTQAALEAWLHEAGFEQPVLIDLPEWLNSNLMVTRKPGRRVTPGQA